MREFRYAWKRALPILLTYFFLAAGFGIMLQQAGLGSGWAAFASIFIYSGAFQYVVVSFLTAGTSLVTVALTALIMDSRQFFYGFSFLEDFRKGGWKYPYLVWSLTDETYALLTSLVIPEELDRPTVEFWVQLLSQLSWVLGSVFGAVMGAAIPFDFEGIDFLMTALFVTIVIDQWKRSANHFPALLGFGSSIVFLLLVGAANFILPTLVFTTVILTVSSRREANAVETDAGESENCLDVIPQAPAGRALHHDAARPGSEGGHR